MRRRWDSLSDSSAALCYLRTSVLNGCRTAIRRKSRPPKIPADGRSAESAEAAVLVGEEHRAVLAAIRRLPARQRQALVLRYYLDMTEDQAADAMRVSRAITRPRGFRPWMAPAGAVAAVTALAISVLLVKAMPNAPAAPAAHPAAPHGVPPYYMALPGADDFVNHPGAPAAVLAETVTGKRLATVRPSGNDKFISVSAAADDRTFVLGAAQNLELVAVPSATTWYLVRVHQGGPAPTVHKLPIPAPPSGATADTTALSPDGKRLALLGIEPGQGQSHLEFLSIYSVPGGKLLRSWSGPLNPGGSAYTTLAWMADGRQLASGYTWQDNGGVHFGVRALEVNRPGKGLIADSRLAWSVRIYQNVPKTYPLTCATNQRAVVTADGTVVCPATSVFRDVKQTFGGPVCPAIPAWNSAGFLEYSTATGKLVRTAYQAKSNCVPESVDVLWAGDSGKTFIGYIEYGHAVSPNRTVLKFGIFSDGKFTALPAPPTIATTPDAIAW